MNNRPLRVLVFLEVATFALLGTSARAQPDAGGLGAGGAAASDAAVLGNPGTGIVGKACKTSLDCGVAGIDCVPATSNAFAGSGPPGGICTIDCSSGNDATCQALDPDSVCVGFGALNSEAFCLEVCEQGDSGSLHAKCHGRRDMACDTGGFCDPVCRGDADCAGRHCDPSSGRCVDQLFPGDPTGAACDPNATQDSCAGLCVPLGTGLGECAQVCALDQAGCDFDPNSRAPIDAYCAFVSNQNESTGDLGYCGQLCDCNGDCRNSAFVCSALPADLARQLGRAGSCGPATFDPGSGKRDPGIACSLGGGGSGGGGGAGGLGAIGRGGTSGGGNQTAGQTSTATGGATETGPAGGEDAGHSITADAGARQGGSEHGSGCGCRVGEEPSAPAPLGLGLLLGLVASLRRRRPDRRS